MIKKENMKTTLNQIFLISIAFLSINCSSQQRKEAAQTDEGQNHRAIIFVSNYPLQYFTQRIAGPLAEVEFPAKDAGDPAYWEPVAEDIAAMQQADLIILNGASYEQWLKNVSLPPSKTFDCTAGLKERLIIEEETVTHSHGAEGEHTHAGTTFTTWMDLALAADQARAIRDKLIAQWPENRSQFESQFAALEKDLLAIDAELQSMTAQSSGITVIFSHPVYQYFQRRYGVKGHSMHWEPGEVPSEAMLEELRHELEHQPTEWMIWEGQPLPETVEKLMSMGIGCAVIDPAGNIPVEGDFLTTWRGNAEAFRQVIQNEER